MKRNAIVVAIMVFLLLGLVVSGVAPAAEKDATFPTRPITVIVPFAPGGGVDTTARLVSAYWEKVLGKAIFVVNKPGGSGMIAMRELKNSPADGYTLACAGYPDVWVPPHLKGTQAGYTLDDFATIGGYPSMAGALMVMKKDFKTLKEFSEAAKKKPGTLSIACSGQGWMLNIMELESELGITLNTILFKSGGEALNALLGGHVNALMSVVSHASTNKERGVIPLVLMGGDKRVDSFPETPTLKELGYDVDYVFQFPIVVHKNTPQPVLDKLVSTFKELEKNTEFIGKVKGAGYNFTPRFGVDMQNYLKLNNARLKKLIEKNKEKFTD
jgi:putative tricarboxylic transport membrane protein